MGTGSATKMPEVGRQKLMTFPSYENQDIIQNDDWCQGVEHESFHLCLRAALSSGPCPCVPPKLHMCIRVKWPMKGWVSSGNWVMFCRYSSCKAQSFLGPNSKFSGNGMLSLVCSCVIFVSSIHPPFIICFILRVQSN